jgi:hypothetical protein
MRVAERRVCGIILYRHTMAIDFKGDLAIL